MSMIAGDNPDGLPPTESVLSYLAKELELTSQKITAYHIRSEHAITSGIALVGGILTAAASLKIPTLLVFMPFGLSLVVILSQYLNAEALALGGYKAVLEEEINKLVEYPVTMWESRIAHSRHRDISTWAMRLMVATSFILLTIIGSVAGISELNKSETNQPRWLLTVLGGIATATIGAILMIASGLHAHRHFRHVQDATRKVFEEAHILNEEKMNEEARKERLSCIKLPDPRFK